MDGPGTLLCRDDHLLLPCGPTYHLPVGTYDPRYLLALWPSPVALWPWGLAVAVAGQPLRSCPIPTQSSHRPRCLGHPILRCFRCPASFDSCMASAPNHSLWSLLRASLHSSTRGLLTPCGLWGSLLAWLAVAVDLATRVNYGFLQSPKSKQPNRNSLCSSMSHSRGRFRVSLPQTHAVCHHRHPVCVCHFSQQETTKVDQTCIPMKTVPTISVGMIDKRREQEIGQEKAKKSDRK